jgi:hypothetical protein
MTNLAGRSLFRKRLETTIAEKWRPGRKRGRRRRGIRNQGLDWRWTAGPGLPLGINSLQLPFPGAPGSGLSREVIPAAVQPGFLTVARGFQASDLRVVGEQPADPFIADAELGTDLLVGPRRGLQAQGDGLLDLCVGHTAGTSKLPLFTYSVWL